MQLMFWTMTHCKSFLGVEKEEEYFVVIDGEEKNTRGREILTHQSSNFDASVSPGSSSWIAVAIVEDQVLDIDPSLFNAIQREEI